MKTNCDNHVAPGRIATVITLPRRTSPSAILCSPLDANSRATWQRRHASVILPKCQLPTRQHRHRCSLYPHLLQHIRSPNVHLISLTRGPHHPPHLWHRGSLASSQFHAEFGFWATKTFFQAHLRFAKHQQPSFPLSHHPLPLAPPAPPHVTLSSPARLDNSPGS